MPVALLSSQPADEVAGATASRPLPPPLKWAGGKRWQLPILRTHWAPHAQRRLVEPFCGGLAVALGLSPAAALLNDINPHLINFYRQLQRGLFPPPLKRSRRDYYQRRREFNRLVGEGQAETPEAAGLFYYLNRCGYNGLCRFNQQGGFNVPFGRHKTVQYHEDLSDYRVALADWTFTVGPFEAMPLEPGDFVYADPPYDVEFTHYAGNHFTWEDQVRTAEWLATHTGPVILSNQATKAIMELYGDLGFRTERHQAPRRISCNGDRAPATEVLAFRNL
jgi:DNA adenine methylase